MGWIAISDNNEVTREETHARPVQAGEEGTLKVIAQEDFGHRVAVDLKTGIIAIDYENDISVQNGTIELVNPKVFLFICDETNIVGELFDVKRSEPDKEGWFSNTIIPLIWRPIWFTRYTNGVPTKVIGAQTTLPEAYGGHNVKKMVSLFADGRVGIF